MAALIRTSRAASWSLMSRSPSRRNNGTNFGASRLPAVACSTFQHVISARVTAGEYVGAQPGLGLTTFNLNALRE